jgi:general secretion pathway protein F
VATYTFKSVGPDGQIVRGVIAAADQQEAIQMIRSDGAIPISAELQSQGWFSKIRNSVFRQSGKQKLGARLESFALQMSSLLEAGITVDECLQIIQRTTDDALIVEFAAAIDSGIHAGKSLTEATETSDFEIPKVGFSILRTSEASGDLAKGFASLAQELERSRDARERMKSALLYPVILTGVSALSLIAIFTFVIPQFAQLFSDMGDALPLLTRMVLAVAEVISRWGLLILMGIFVSIWLVRSSMRDERRLLVLHRKVLRWRQIGSLVLRFQAERYFRSLGALLESGMTLINAMVIARESLTNLHLVAVAKESEILVAEGVSLSDAMAKSRAWPPLAVQLLRVGERTGDLKKMLNRLSTTFESEVRTATDRLLSMLEPLLVVFLGFVIAIIIISVLMGIMSVNELPI